MPANSEHVSTECGWKDGSHKKRWAVGVDFQRTFFARRARPDFFKRGIERSIFFSLSSGFAATSRTGWLNTEMEFKRRTIQNPVNAPLSHFSRRTCKNVKKYSDPHVLIWPNYRRCTLFRLLNCPPDLIPVLFVKLWRLSVQRSFCACVAALVLMDFQNRAGGKTGTYGVASASQEATDRRERLRKLALESIDLQKDPYYFRNHVGQTECKLNL